MDTVHEGTRGFLFAEYSVEAFWGSLSRALEVYRNDKAAWRALQQGGMTADFSWTTSARGYQQVFDWAIARVRGW